MRAAERRLTAGASADLRADLEIQRFFVAFYQQRDLTAARDQARRARELLEETLGPDHPRLLEGLRLESAALLELGDVEAAIAASRRGLELTERAYGEQHPNLAAAASGLGRALVRRGDHADARVQLERALAIRERATPGGLAIAVSLRDLADLTEKEGDLDAARKYNRDALAIYESTLGRDNDATVGTVVDLANQHLVAGELESACPLFDRALAAYGPDHPDVGAPLTGLGTLLADSGRCKEAIGYLERARRALARTGQESLQTTYPMIQIARCHLEGGRTDQALTLFEQAETIPTAKKAEPMLLAEVRFFAAQALWKKSRRQQAIARAESARVTGAPRALIDEIDAWLAARR